MSEGAGTDDRRRMQIVAGVCALGAVGVLGAVALLSAPAEPDTEQFARGSVPPVEIRQLRPAVEAAGCTAAGFREEGDGVVAGEVPYSSDPPHSGQHAPEPADERAYYRDPPSDETVVHALRHGRVVIWFDPELDEQDKGNLKALFDEDPAHMLLAPRESMPYAVAASAWTNLLTCPELNGQTLDALRAFRAAHRDRGPEFVP